jgi:hypothetical protein
MAFSIVRHGMLNEGTSVPINSDEPGNLCHLLGELGDRWQFLRLRRRRWLGPCVEAGERRHGDRGYDCHTLQDHGPSRFLCCTVSRNSESAHQRALRALVTASRRTCLAIQRVTPHLPGCYMTGFCALQSHGLNASWFLSASLHRLLANL